MMIWIVVAVLVISIAYVISEAAGKNRARKKRLEQIRARLAEKEADSQTTATHREPPRDEPLKREE